MKNLIFDKMGAKDFTHRRNDPLNDDPAGFDEMIDGQPVQLTYGGAGHIMGTYRMGDNPRRRSSIRTSAPMITTTCIWSEAARFRPAAPPIRR